MVSVSSHSPVMRVNTCQKAGAHAPAMTSRTPGVRVFNASLELSERWKRGASQTRRE